MIYLLLIINTALLAFLLLCSETFRRGAKYVMHLFQRAHSQAEDSAQAEGEVNASIENASEILDVSFDEADECISRALQMLQVEAESKDEESYRIRRFSFQAFEFTLTLFREEERGMVLIFPGANSSTIDYIDEIRLTCNEVNTRTLPIQAVYVSDAEDNKVYMHLSCHLVRMRRPEVLAEKLAQAMKGCFSAAKLMDKILDQYIAQRKDTGVSDLEYHEMCNERINSLLCETEMYHDVFQYTQTARPYNAGGEMIMETLLTRWHILPPESDIVRMEVEKGDDRFTMENRFSILHYPLRLMLVDTLNGMHTVVARQTTVKLFFRLPIDDKDDDALHTVYFTFEMVRETDEAIYYRVGYLSALPTLSAPSDTHSAESALHGNSGFVMLGIDKEGDKRIRSEFTYMWHDAADKLAEGKSNELTPEQRLIVNLTQPDVAFNLYWGNRYLREERYFEATLLLQRARAHLANNYGELSKSDRRTFDAISFRLAVCHLKLNEPQLACYYALHMEGEMNDARLRLIIDSLIASHDPHAASHIETAKKNVEAQMKESTDEGMDVPDTLYDLQNFLRRREVYLAVEMKQYETARLICQKMLDEPANSDFAVSELAFISQMTRKDHPLSGEPFSPY